jgi:hypothetical protein
MCIDGLHELNNKATWQYPKETAIENYSGSVFMFLHGSVMKK